MSTCPFCDQPIDPDIASNGGSCPHCFAHVPGEDTPTDPGEPVEAEQGPEPASRSGQGPMIGVAALCVLGLGLWTMRPAAEAPTELTFDGFEVDLADAEAWQQPQPAKRPAQEPMPRARSAEASRRVTHALAEPAPVKVVRASEPAAPAASPSPTQMGFAVQASRKQAVLENGEGVRDAVVKMFRSRGGALQRCHERVLKGGDAVSGRWEVAFRMELDGSLSNVVVEPSGTPHAALEACLANEVGGWKLGYRLARVETARMPVRFAAP